MEKLGLFPIVAGCVGRSGVERERSEKGEGPKNSRRKR